MVRQHDAETNLRCAIVLDATGSMGYADKAVHAARLTAAVAHLLLSAGEMVGLAVTGATPHWLPPATGTGQLSRVIDALDRVRPAGPADWPAVGGPLAARLGRRAVVVVVSDLLAPAIDVRAALARLRHGRHDVTVLRVLHPDERRFPFRGAVRLRGMEGERPVVVDPATARAAYVKQFDRHRGEVAAACRILGVRLHETSTTDAVATVVAAVLRPGG